MITSTDNKKVKEVIKLIQKGKERRERGLYVIEGEHLFAEAPKEDIVSVFASESFMKKGFDFGEIPEEIVETVSDDVFKKMTDTITPQGVLCVMKRKNYSLDSLFSDLGEKPLFVLLEGIQDPGNLGTILRTAEGAGARAVIMSADTVDLYNPKTVRSTQGSIFRVPFVYTDDIKDAVSKLKSHGIPCYAAHLKGKKTFKEADYSKGACFFIGNEGNGLTDETAGLADEYIIIPMGGKLESLNAAVSAAILMYQLV